MKLLILAQTPPPLHGQSIMVEALVTHLPARGLALHHVNLRLSHDVADIGRWRPGKIFATFGAAWRAIAARFTQGCDTLYYVPAPPGKRGALYRDWLLMALCRPFYARLVLHWHAGGLGEWLETRATLPEWVISRLLLGRAALSIVLANGLRHDAESLSARQIAIVPNGVADPGEPSAPAAAPPFQVLFLALCSEEKGLFAAAQAVIEANQRGAPKDDAPAFVFTAAGPFVDDATAIRFRELAGRHPRAVRHVGVLDEAGKRRQFADAHALCFPTRYPAETFSLVVLEALAHDRPVIATCWRAIPDIVTAEVGKLVAVGDHASLVEALLALRAQPPAAGVCRARFLAHFTLDQHVAAVERALRLLAV